MEAGKAAAASEEGGGVASEGSVSPGTLQSQQPRKTMRRGFFMTMLQRKANQVSRDTPHNGVSAWAPCPVSTMVVLVQIWETQ